MPHICKRNKIYYVFWYENHKHHCKAISPSYKEAEQWSANLTLRLYARKNGLPLRHYPFNTFIKEYIEEYVKYKRPRTQERDMDTIKLLLKLFPNIEYVTDFNDQTLKEFIKKRKLNNKKNSTINRELITLKHIQRIGYIKKYYEEDITLRTKFLPDITNETKYIPSNEEIQYIFDKINEPLKTAFVLGLTCGMRAGEVCHIELTDIDFDNNIIHIRPKKDWQPKNNTSIRDVPIHKNYLNYLSKQYKRALKLKSKFICCYEDGRKLNEDVITALIIKLRKKYNIDKRFHFHCLRHKFITMSGDTGIPMIHIKNIVGHKNIELTQNLYYHSSNIENINSVNKIKIPLKIK